MAHNGAAYDIRLIFESLRERKVSMRDPIMTGTKFFELVVENRLKFRDSRNHLNSALANLARDYETPTLKGFFPHLFNHTKNYAYNGPIPAKEFFDLSHFKNDKDFEEFNRWHDSFEGEWNFIDQLKLYCKNDVEVLASVVRKYHDIYFEKFAQSPWKFMTGSSYFHYISKLKVTRNLELPDKKDESYAEAIASKYKESWAVLRPIEYNIVRAALRGGRTGIGRILCELSAEQIARGCKIKYVDVVSLYPYQQVAHDFPVGPPKIHVFDLDFAPCTYHYNEGTHCQCPQSLRYHTQNNYYQKIADIEIHEEEWDTETILSKHGYIVATVEPPQMLHPILVRYDEDELKCNATCEIIEKGCFTSPEFHAALLNGYKIIKLHRFDEYKMAAPLWEDFVKEMYIFKMVNSANKPEGEKMEELLHVYEDRFEMGDMIMKTFEPNIWGKNPAKKAAAKTGLNSGWGKHAQRLVLTQATIINWEDESSARKGDAYFNDVQNGLRSFKSGMMLSENVGFYTSKKDGRDAKHDYTNSYLPAACFVPAYGRLQLWEQLNKLGDRVLMYDTDSVVYIYDPEQYNVPQSKIWGDWEEEEISEIGITGFVGLGPKSYAMRCVDETKNIVKLKGISQKRSTEKLLNYESLKELVLKNIETREMQEIAIPQTIFNYRIGEGIKTLQSLKILSFDYRDQKGNVGENYFMYPKGYLNYNPI